MTTDSYCVNRISAVTEDVVIIKHRASYVKSMHTAKI